MPRVPRRLLDHVHEDPPEAHLVREATIRRQLVKVRRARSDLKCAFALLVVEPQDRLDCVGGLNRELGRDVTAQARVVNLLVGEGLAKSSALGPGEVLHDG